MDYTNERCGKRASATILQCFVHANLKNVSRVAAQDCDPSLGAPCSAHEEETERIFASARECCDVKLSWQSDCLYNSGTNSTGPGVPTASNFTTGFWYPGKITCGGSGLTKQSSRS